MGEGGLLCSYKHRRQCESSFLGGSDGRAPGANQVPIVWQACNRVA